MRRGSKLGKYRLDRRIGAGSFAEVWKARDSIERRDVALKIASPRLVEEFGRDEIEHEARIGSSLSHPHIVSVRNADWIDGYFVIASDLAAKNLAQYSGARRSVSVALNVISDVASGLAYAHGQQVVHRDLKPENVLIFRGRRAALSDFGVARRTRDGSMFTEAGTLGFMAPEQAYGKTRFASDVFSLGLVAYELLSGTLPGWPFEWPFEGHQRFTRRTPELVQAVVRRAVSVSIDKRQRDAVVFNREFSEAIRRIQTKPPTRRRRRVSAQTITPFDAEVKLFLLRHRYNLELIADCFRCNGPISEAMSFCPWCGTSENSFIEITRYPLVCPDCERGVRREWPMCPWCYRGRFDNLEQHLRLEKYAQRKCPRRSCSGELLLFMRYCPLCKERVTRPWIHPDLPDRCRNCSWSVSDLFWRFCAWCGHRGARSDVPIKGLQ